MNAMSVIALVGSLALVTMGVLRIIDGRGQMKYTFVGVVLLVVASGRTATLLSPANHVLIQAITSIVYIVILAMYLIDRVSESQD